MALSDRDVYHLQRCVELAEQALVHGNDPFGSMLVDAQGVVVKEALNRVGGGDATRHPEFALARWAAEHMTPEARADATVYTSGEHCPMCAAAHAWVGLGRIVYASSMQQLVAWLDGLGAPRPPLAVLSIRDVAPGVAVDGPHEALAARVRRLHARRQQAD